MVVARSASTGSASAPRSPSRSKAVDRVTGSLSRHAFRSSGRQSSGDRLVATHARSASRRSGGWSAVRISRKASRTSGGAWRRLPMAARASRRSGPAPPRRLASNSGLAASPASTQRVNCSCAGACGLRSSRFASETDRNHQMATPAPMTSRAKTSEGNPRRVTCVMLPPPFAGDQGRRETCLRPTVARISPGDGVTRGPCRVCLARVMPRGPLVATPGAAD